MEIKNVYDHLEYQDVVAQLKQQLQELRVKYKDSEALDQHYIDAYDNL
jgi:hypothetical protein